MSAKSFNQPYDPRDLDISDLVGRIEVLGVLCLVVMESFFPQPVKAARLAFMLKVKDARKTLTPVLNTCEIYGYLTRTGSSPHETVHITDIGRQVAALLNASHAASTPALPSAGQPAKPLLAAAQIVDNSPISVDKPLGDFLPPDLSSSSDLIDQSIRIDQSINLEEEEKSRPEIPEPDRQAAAARWCDTHCVTGDKRRAILADPFATAARLNDWHTEMIRRGQSGAIKFRNKYGPINYAITCVLNHDECPNPWASQRATPVNDDESDDYEPEKFSEPETPRPVVVSQPARNDSMVKLEELWSTISAAVKTKSPDFYNFVFVHCRAVALSGNQMIVRVDRIVHDLFEQNRAKLEILISELIGSTIAIVTHVA